MRLHPDNIREVSIGLEFDTNNTLNQILGRLGLKEGTFFVKEEIKPIEHMQQARQRSSSDLLAPLGGGGCSFSHQPEREMEAPNTIIYVLSLSNYTIENVSKGERD
jgi:hypothetical protein